MLGDCAHLGRQTENENSPLTPECLPQKSGRLVHRPDPHYRVRIRFNRSKSSLLIIVALTELDAARERLLAALRSSPLTHRSVVFVKDVMAVTKSCLLHRVRMHVRRHVWRVVKCLNTNEDVVGGENKRVHSWDLCVRKRTRSNYCYRNISWVRDLASCSLTLNICTRRRLFADRRVRATPRRSSTRLCRNSFSPSASDRLRTLVSREERSPLRSVAFLRWPMPKVASTLAPSARGFLKDRSATSHARWFPWRRAGACLRSRLVR